MCGNRASLSADIRRVGDALGLCYTQSHVDTFVLISGDSDFSPWVSTLRENNKYVIGVGVKDSTSDLLSANCDEFIFCDDLVREQEAKRDEKSGRYALPTANEQGPRAPPQHGRRPELARKLQKARVIPQLRLSPLIGQVFRRRAKVNDRSTSLFIRMSSPVGKW